MQRPAGPGPKRSAHTSTASDARRDPVETPRAAGDRFASRDAPVSEFFYRALIEQTSDIISVVDADGIFLYVSPSHQRLIGYEPAEMLGRNSFDFVHPDDIEWLAARFRIATQAAQQTKSGPFRVRHKDGSWRTFESIGTNLFDDPSIGGLLVNARDVTDRIRLEEEVAEQRRQLADRLAELRLLYRTAPVGLAVLDTQVRYVQVNDRLAAMNGIPPAEHVGRLPRDIIGTLGEPLEAICRHVIETGEPTQAMEVHGSTPAAPGVEKDWLVHYHRLEDAAGSPIGLSAVIEEITALKDAERAIQRSREELEVRVRDRTAELVSVNQALRAEIAERERVDASLRRSEERYRHLVENINEVIFTLDPHGVVTYVSPSIERATGGYAPAEVLGRSFIEFVHPDDAPELLQSFQRLLEGETEPSEYRVFGKDGSVRWLRTASQTVLEDGHVVAVQGVLTDVTARRRAEMDARQQREALAHVQRVTTAGEMTAEIAHQINQPLAAIVNFAAGLATRLRDGKVQPDAMREVAERIAAEARRAGEVISRLRAFLRKGESTLRDCDLNLVVTRVYGLLEDDFRRETVDAHLLLDRRLPMLQLDAILIEQVLLNLLRNALEALTPLRADARRLDVATSLADARACVTVTDSGIGLPPGGEGNIFEAFYTTKPEGLGLGLSVSRSIIKAVGGQLWAESNPGGGATVGFSLPLASAARI